jgi:uncharacterized protein YndB with AHSA1/START domain
VAKLQTAKAVFIAHAPIDLVWDTIADARSWPTWSPNSDAWLDAEGTPDPDGVGARRRFKTGRIVVREEVTTFEPPHHFEYRLLSGLPVQDYVAEILLTEIDEGTSIDWHSRFRVGIPFTRRMLGRRMQWILDRFGAALVDHVEALAADDARSE